VGEDRRYGWVESSELLEAACFTAVVGVPIDEVIRRFGADPSSERRMTFAESFTTPRGATTLVCDELDGAVLVAENNGWQGSRGEVAEEVSRGGRFASVYWSANADMSFLYLEDGVVVAAFDPLLVEHPWSGSDPDSVRRRARDLPFGVDLPRAASLALLERLTGTRLGRGWLEQPHRCLDVPDLQPGVFSQEVYRSLVRQALRSWWRRFRGKG